MIGVLITNLGTPTAPTRKALRRFLGEFLADPRVVELPRILWLPLLHSIILAIRPQRSAKLYQKIWTANGSPLLVYSQQLTHALQRTLALNVITPIKVALGMRYGQPSIKHALAELRSAGINKLLVLPLYPQYAAATTASTFDSVSKELSTWRSLPALRMVTEYASEPTYIETIARTIKTYWQEQGTPDYLLFSFHGLPKRCTTLGDPYQQQCESTAQQIAYTLGLNNEQWGLAFQSRFGKAEWLQPYCDRTLQALPARGYKKVAVVCPGFAVDCLETLEEINQLNRELFMQAGGSEFHYIPALNSSPEQVNLLTEIIIKQLQGWL